MEPAGFVWLGNAPKSETEAGYYSTFSKFFTESVLELQATWKDDNEEDPAAKSHCPLSVLSVQTLHQPSLLVVYPNAASVTSTIQLDGTKLGTNSITIEPGKLPVWVHRGSHHGLFLAYVGHVVFTEADESKLSEEEAETLQEQRKRLLNLCLDSLCTLQEVKALLDSCPEQVHNPAAITKQTSFSSLPMSPSYSQDEETSIVHDWPSLMRVCRDVDLVFHPSVLSVLRLASPSLLESVLIQTLQSRLDHPFCVPWARGIVDCLTSMGWTVVPILRNLALWSMNADHYSDDLEVEEATTEEGIVKRARAQARKITALRKSQKQKSTLNDQITAHQQVIIDLDDDMDDFEPLSIRRKPKKFSSKSSKPKVGSKRPRQTGIQEMFKKNQETERIKKKRRESLQQEKERLVDLKNERVAVRKKLARAHGDAIFKVVLNSWANIILRDVKLLASPPAKLIKELEACKLKI